MFDLCPSCGMRDADDEDTGWCKPCAGTAVTESYEERKVTARRDRWLDWLAQRRKVS
jgi:hypothetical protein